MAQLVAAICLFAWVTYEMIFMFNIAVVIFLFIALIQLALSVTALRDPESVQEQRRR